LVLVLVSEHLSSLTLSDVIGFTTIGALLDVTFFAKYVFAACATMPITIFRIAGDEVDEVAARKGFVSLRADKLNLTRATMISLFVH
jgi:hypothetical protein